MEICAGFLQEIPDQYPQLVALKYTMFNENLELNQVCRLVMISVTCCSSEQLGFLTVIFVR